jgi:hypothetical protein
MAWARDHPGAAWLNCDQAISDSRSVLAIAATQEKYQDLLGQVLQGMLMSVGRLNIWRRRIPYYAAAF